MPYMHYKMYGCVRNMYKRKVSYSMVRETQREIRTNKFIRLYEGEMN
jgi:hypothetical protein